MRLTQVSKCFGTYHPRMHWQSGSTHPLLTPSSSSSSTRPKKITALPRWREREMSNEIDSGSTPSFKFATKSLLIASFLILIVTGWLDHLFLINELSLYLFLLAHLGDKKSVVYLSNKNANHENWIFCQTNRVGCEFFFCMELFTSFTYILYSISCPQFKTVFSIQFFKKFMIHLLAWLCKTHYESPTKNPKLVEFSNWK